MNPSERNSDYLWDRSGPPDPEVARLEALLGPLRHRGEPPAWPEDVAPAARWRPTPAARRLLLAAALTSVVLAAFAALRLGGGSGGWRLTSYAGAPTIDDALAPRGSRLRPGQALTTDQATRAHLLLPRVGEIEIAPGTAIRVLADRRDAQSLQILHGSLLARTWAPPKLFSIETPMGRAVDYGCAYALDVDRAGTTRLRVEMGWVALEVGGREALVPAGAALRSGARDRIGSPVWLDAPREFRAAVERFDAAAPGSPERREALATTLSLSRERDALTLWHLLAAPEADERAAVFDRLAQFVPPPAAAEREALLRGDPDARRAWFENLGLGIVPGWM